MTSSETWEHRVRTVWRVVYARESVESRAKSLYFSKYSNRRSSSVRKRSTCRGGETISSGRLERPGEGIGSP